MPPQNLNSQPPPINVQPNWDNPLVVIKRNPAPKPGPESKLSPTEFARKAAAELGGTTTESEILAALEDTEPWFIH